ncbi:glycosyltransferase family 4 protein [Salinibacter ruber]|uniref:glycosyltransferase family 4 protein n=1 Tax=Salinibacter ruber TaxID=146919 RepID=UPI002169E0EC|nr:glycosyltransferase family 4 protein [Salinibacter ruber]MCS3642386.1 glycosyltransferase involved in cell wall biosynthesis [Salinibacter ruber]
MTSSSPVAVLFDRFGPYHRARLEAAGRRLPVTAVEFAGDSATYDWKSVEGGEHFRRRTLFRNTDSASVPPGELIKAVESELDSLRPAAVAVPGWSHPGALAALRWCARTRTPAVLMSETTAHDFERHWWRELPKRRLLRVAGAALVGGRAHEEYLEMLGLPPDQVFWGYDVVDNDHFARGAQRARRQAETRGDLFGLPRPYFLASGRFVEKKNFPGLIEAFAGYRRTVADPWDLVILGDGPTRPDIEQAINRNELRDAVHLPGFKQYDELPPYYGLAGAFVHPSTTEQWGLVVNEAMAVGLPVLVSERCGCAPDLVDAGRNGYTFDPADPSDIAHTLQRVSQAEDGLDEMGQASREIIANWTPDRFGRGLERAVEQARDVKPPTVSFFDRCLLTALMYR